MRASGSEGAGGGEGEEVETDIVRRGEGEGRETRDGTGSIYLFFFFFATGDNDLSIYLSIDRSIPDVGWRLKIRSLRIGISSASFVLRLVGKFEYSCLEFFSAV